MAITTGKVRASFVHIFQPRQQDDGEPKYSVTLLVPKADTATLNAIYAEIEKTKQEGAQKVFGGSVPPGCRVPIYDGDGLRPTSGEPFGEECKGHMVLTASAKLPPSVVGLDMQAILNPAEVYSGCYIRANINFFAYNQKGNKGVGCGLNAVQKVADGEPLTVRISAEEAFGGNNSYTESGMPAAGYPGAVTPGTVSGQAYQTTTPMGIPGQTYQTTAPMGIPGQTYQTTAPMGIPGQTYQSTAPMGMPGQTYQTTAPAGMPVQSYQGTAPGMPLQPGYPAQTMDPITGKPYLNGGVMGIG